VIFISFSTLLCSEVHTHISCERLNNGTSYCNTIAKIAQVDLPSIEQLSKKTNIIAYV